MVAVRGSGVEAQLTLRIHRDETKDKRIEDRMNAHINLKPLNQMLESKHWFKCSDKN